MREWMTARGKERLAARAGLHLRSAFGIAGSEGRTGESLTYREMAEKLVEYVKSMGLYAYGIAAHDGASVWRLLGLSGDRVFCTHRALRLTG